MHIPWGWIKQRPHFIAEGLSKKYNVTVICPKTFRKYPSNNTTVNRVELFRFPLERLSVVRKLNKMLYLFQIKKYIKKNDLIWVTSPLKLPQVIYNCLDSKKVIYDCMDDMLEFSGIKREEVMRMEKMLYQRADIVFCSSDYLLSVLKARYIDRENLYVVNNAVREFTTDEFLRVKKNKIRPFTSKIKMVYVGTISEWFDFDLINYLQKNILNLDLYLFGPKDTNIPQSERIHYEGIIEHDFVFSVMDEADILIMPFKITQLILSVNPVKLYEYILSGRPCLAPAYTESLKFGEYVYLYNDKNDCLRIVEDIISRGFAPLKSREESLLFVRNNTWVQRLKQITTILDSVL